MRKRLQLFLRRVQVDAHCRPASFALDVQLFERQQNRMRTDAKESTHIDDSMGDLVVAPKLMRPDRADVLVIAAKDGGAFKIGCVQVMRSDTIVTVTNKPEGAASAVSRPCIGMLCNFDLLDPASPGSVATGAPCRPYMTRPCDRPTMRALRRSRSTTSAALHLSRPQKCLWYRPDHGPTG